MANYISKHTGQQIDDAVTAFLNGTGTGGGSGSSVSIDATLTQSGKAADAKATGDRLTALSEEIEKLKGTSNEVTMSGAMVAVTPGQGKNLEVVQHFDSPNALDKLYLHQVTSENLFDFVTWFGGAGKVYEKNGLRAVINADSTVTVTGTNTSASSTNIIDVSGKQPYAYHVFPAGKYNVGYSKMRVAITGVETGTNYGNKTETFEIPEPFRIRGVFVGYAAGEGTDVFNTQNMFMVKTDSDAVDQSPADCTYVGNVHTATFATHIAAGTLNWNTGEVKDKDGNLVETVTPTEFTALAGTNKIFGAFGNVDVTYEAEVNCGADQIVPESEYEWEAPTRQFAALFNNTDNVESFLFFTDPHLVHYSGWEKQFPEYTDFIAKVYNKTPTSFCVCGGDWLGNSDTMDEACYKMGLIDGRMRSLIDEYCPIVGNHDTNYQGKLDANSEKNTGILTDATIRNLWFRREGAAYYRYQGATSAMYVMDSGLDTTGAMSAYRWQQIDWLAESLKVEKMSNAFIAMHIIKAGNSSTTVIPLTDNAMALAEAYNARTTITMNSKTYDFTGCTGKVRFVIGGHLHADATGSAHNIPFVITTQARQNDVPTFDLALADYDGGTLHLVRVGDGESRTVTMA